MTRLKQMYEGSGIPRAVLDAIGEKAPQCGAEPLQDRIKALFWQSFLEACDDWLWALDSEARARLGTLDPSDCETISKLRDLLR